MEEFTHLPYRSVIRVSGPEALKFLDGLVTNSLTRLKEQSALHTGLLSPQGKIQFDFFVVKAGEDLLLDVPAAQIENLIKRLTFYRLRADVEIVDERPSLTVAVKWRTDDVRIPNDCCIYRDPRCSKLGYRMIVPIESLADWEQQANGQRAYHAHRIHVGVPEVEYDYEVENTFPHEALYDILGSVDFTKGCFVGQEVVSRMQHRGTARRRIVPVRGEKPLVSGASIEAELVAIGQMGSVAGNLGLAKLRLDRVAEAVAKGHKLMASGNPIEIDKRSWLPMELKTGRKKTNG